MTDKDPDSQDTIKDSFHAQRLDVTDYRITRPTKKDPTLTVAVRGLPTVTFSDRESAITWFEENSRDLLWRLRNDRTGDNSSYNTVHDAVYLSQFPKK